MHIIKVGTLKLEHHPQEHESESENATLQRCPHVETLKKYKNFKKKKSTSCVSEHPLLSLSVSF